MGRRAFFVLLFIFLSLFAHSCPVKRLVFSRGLTVIRRAPDELVKENIAAKGTVNSFRLNDGEFFINDIRQPETVHQRFKNMFSKRTWISDLPG